MPQTLAGLSIANGLIVSKHAVDRTTTYTVDSEASQAGKLIIEHPIHNDFQLMSQESLEETTEDMYRFVLTALPGESVALAVPETRTVEEKIPLATIDEAQTQRYLASDKVSDGAKEIFRQLLAGNREQTETAAAILRNRDIVRDISGMQSRIRDNMQVLDRTSELYLQYVRTLSEQERQLEELTRKLQDLEAARQQQEAALAQFVRDASA